MDTSVSFAKVGADPTAINFRNEVSHALISISNFNHPNSLSLIHDIMILGALHN